MMVWSTIPLDTDWGKTSSFQDGWARRFFQKWFAWAVHSRLEPIRKVAAILQTHLNNILTYCHHRVTNAVAEGLNSKILAIKRRACGYRNKDYFKVSVKAVVLDR